MINYHDLRAKLEESIAMYEHAIAEFDAFISEYGLQDAFNTFCERAARGIEGSKMTLDEAEDTGGNYDEADIEAERKEEERRQEKEKRQEEEDKKKLNQKSEQVNKRDEYELYKSIFEISQFIQYEPEIHSRVLPNDQIRIYIHPETIKEVVDGHYIEFEYDDMSVDEEMELIEANAPEEYFEPYPIKRYLNLETGHIEIPEIVNDQKEVRLLNKSFEKGVLVALVNAMKRMTYLGENALYIGNRKQIKDLMMPIKDVIDYVALSRSSYNLFSCLYKERILKLNEESDSFDFEGAVAISEDEYYNTLLTSLKKGNTGPLIEAYKKIDESVNILKKAAEADPNKYCDALDVEELIAGAADPLYYFKDLTEVQTYARARIKELEEPDLDKKKRKTR